MGRRACSFCSTREASSWSQAVCLTSMTPSSRSVHIVSSRPSPAGAPAGAARARASGAPALEAARARRRAPSCGSCASPHCRARIARARHPDSPATQRTPRAQSCCRLQDVTAPCLHNLSTILRSSKWTRCSHARSESRPSGQPPWVWQADTGCQPGHGRRARERPPHAGPCGQRKWGARGRAAAGPRLWSCPWRRVARTRESADHTGGRRSERDPLLPADPTAKQVLPLHKYSRMSQRLA